MKSHKAAQKRIGVTGGGKIVRVRSWRGHHLEIKSSRRTRRYAGKTVESADFERIFAAETATDLAPLFDAWVYGR